MTDINNTLSTRHESYKKIQELKGNSEMITQKKIFVKNF